MSNYFKHYSNNQHKFLHLNKKNNNKAMGVFYEHQETNKYPIFKFTSHEPKEKYKHYLFIHSIARPSLSPQFTYLKKYLINSNSCSLTRSQPHPPCALP